MKVLLLALPLLLASCTNTVICHVAVNNEVQVHRLNTGEPWRPVCDRLARAVGGEVVAGEDY